MYEVFGGIWMKVLKKEMIEVYKLLLCNDEKINFLRNGAAFLDSRNSVLALKQNKVGRMWQL
jgi:hypothetical protein